MFSVVRFCKVVFFFVGAGLLSTVAVGSDKSNGCGIGWYFSKDKTILASSMRSSSNITSPQSISMTSGTSGCAEHDIVKADRKTEHFVEANFDALRNDIAAGQGRYLSTLIDTLGCHWTAVDAVSDTTRSHYDYLFRGQSPQAAGMTVGKLRHLIRNQPKLSKACGDA